METRKLLAFAVVGALLAASATGWYLLRNRAPEPPRAAPPAETRTGEKAPSQSPALPKTSGSADTEGDEDDESDLDRDPSGPTGGATTEEILAAIAAGKWLDVERLLSIAGSDDPRVTEALAKSFGDLRWRYKAADLAKYIKDPAALARFLDIAKAEGDENTRSAALHACAILGGPGVAEAAAEILRGARQGSILAGGAAAALGAIGTPEAARTLVDMLRGTLGSFRSAMFVEALGKVQGAEALAELGRLANDQGYDATLREAVLQALGRTRNAAVVPDLLEAARKGESQAVRHAALGALGAVGSPEGVVELLNVVQGGSNEDKIVAATALQGVRSKAAAPLIEKALEGSVPAELKGHLLQALGKSGARGSIPTLEKFAADASEPTGLRATAVRALGDIGDPAAGPAVLGVYEAAARTETALRRECAVALHNVATKEDLPRLRKIHQGTPEQTSEWYTLGSLIRTLETGRRTDVSTR